ncbi:MAG: CPBP family intramembrane metalloprotease [Propionibacteriaceae bacterium]|jgi:membrane protease YdiL (CAAX protease family)|nr:CPBP family intramembrane metalloprotease [Propionibacteriaceae bacterium]
MATRPAAKKKVRPASGHPAKRTTPRTKIDASAPAVITRAPSSASGASSSSAERRGVVANRPEPAATYPLSLIPAHTPASDLTTIRFMGCVMVVIVLAAFSVAVPLVNTAIVGLGYLVSGRPLPWSEYAENASNFVYPIGIVGAHLALGSLIVIVWALLRYFHHRPMAWLWSVSPGVRWRYGIAAGLVALVIFGGVAAHSWITGPGWNPLANWGWFLVLILLTSPLQALAEEVLFRGYLMQVFGSIVRNPWFAIVATALLFALFHGTQGVWLFASRLIFGLAAGILVWRTGGLEAGVVAHIVNNIAAFSLALFSGTLVEIRTITSVGWDVATRDAVVFIVFALLAGGVAHLMRVPRVTPPLTDRS